MQINFLIHFKIVKRIAVCASARFPSTLSIVSAHPQQSVITYRKCV